MGQLGVPLTPQITSADILDDSITSADIMDDEVSTDDIKDGTILPVDLAFSIANGSVKKFHFSDVQNISTNSLIFVSMIPSFKISIPDCNIGDTLDIKWILNRIQHLNVTSSTFFQCKVKHPDLTFITLPEIFSIGHSKDFSFKQVYGLHNFICSQIGDHDIEILWKVQNGTVTCPTNIEGEGRRSISILKISA